MAVLGPAFFARDTRVVAQELIGKYLVRKIRGAEVALMIVETEAYHGQTDLACHARSGRTARNAPMWGSPGHAYVYFTYGMHWMLNLVTGPKDFPSAVLIRGLQAPKSVVRQGVALTYNGPGKLTRALGIDKKLNGLPLTKKSGLWVEDRGARINPRHIIKGPRVGVDYAGLYATKPWRYLLKATSTGRARRSGAAGSRAPARR